MGSLELQALAADTLSSVKKLVLLAVVAAALKAAYELMRKREVDIMQPSGAPYEPAPRPTAPQSTAVPATNTSTGPNSELLSDDLTRVNGIGPVYAGRLHDLGVSGFGSLAAADTRSLADDLGVSESSVAAWQHQAGELSG